MDVREPISEDLRTNIVQALERGMPKAHADRLFGLSVSSAKCYVIDLRARLSPWHPEKGRRSAHEREDEATRKLLGEDVEKHPVTTILKGAPFFCPQVSCSSL